MRVVLAEEEKQFLNLEKEIKRLNQNIADLIKQQNEENKKLSDIKEENIKVSKQSIKLVEDAKVEASDIIAKAKTKLDAALVKETEVYGKSSDLKDLEDKLNEKIKSNNGLEKNLKTATDDVNELKVKIKSAVEIIKKILE